MVEELKFWIFATSMIIIDTCMTNGSKFEPREQMNRALKPGIVRMLNLTRIILQCKCCPGFYLTTFSICFYGHF